MGWSLGIHRLVMLHAGDTGSDWDLTKSAWQRADNNKVNAGQLTGSKFVLRKKTTKNQLINHKHVCLFFQASEKKKKWATQVQNGLGLETGSVSWVPNGKGGTRVWWEGSGEPVWCDLSPVDPTQNPLGQTQAGPPLAHMLAALLHFNCLSLVTL